MKTNKTNKVKNAALSVAVAAGVSGGFFFGKSSENHLATLCPAPVQLARCMILETPHDFGIIQSFRSATQQRKLYAKGRTEPGPKVTWTLNSKHMSGRAFDILVYLPDGSHTWDAKYYKQINEKAAKACSIKLDIPYVWGGTFKNSRGQLVGDWGHFETKSCTVEKQKVDI